MKTFKEYLTEAQKTYMVRIKVAGELPEGFESNLKSYMEKFQTVSFKKVASTPIQEHPHEFPRLKNMEVTIFDVDAEYPIGFQQLEEVLTAHFGISPDHLRVKHPNDQTELTTDEEGEYEPKLTDAEYKDAPSTEEPLFGDEYNMSLFQELMKERKKEETSEGDGKTVEMPEEKENLGIHSKGEGLVKGTGASLTIHSK